MGYVVDDLIYLVCHLLVLFKEIWVHSILLAVILQSTVISSYVHLFVCLSVFFIEQSNRWVQHEEVLQVIFLVLLIVFRLTSCQWNLVLLILHKLNLRLPLRLFAEVVIIIHLLVSIDLSDLLIVVAWPLKYGEIRPYVTLLN